MNASASCAARRGIGPSASRWEQCCKLHLGISRSAADRIVHQIEEFGPDYFVLAQVTGITPDEYRRIRGAISGHALLHAGEEIPIQVDNAPRLVAAVDSLLRSALPAPHTAKPPTSPGDAADFDHGLDRAERGLRASLYELDKLCAMRPDTARRIRLRTAISGTACKLKMIDLQVGV